MKTLTARPLKDYSAVWAPLLQKLVEIRPTKPAAAPPPGMVKIPAVADFDFVVTGVEIEGGNDAGTGVQYPWEDSPRRQHRHRMAIPAFYMDRCPVTNEQFKSFLAATHYQPRDAHNFLRDWKNGSYPEGWGNRPVTWVSLADAREYAKWGGKRLPREWEWQYAAQSTDGRLYPWGNEWKAGAAPKWQSGRDIEPPDPVDAHPEGASPYGVLDMAGNVWQWTDEYVDDRTWVAILRGGSSYRPKGSGWYFPQARKLTEHGKYLLIAPSKDRSAMAGFRCVMDAAQ
jgi:formylglycine-generating enzyme required for sulfatase activity